MTDSQDPAELLGRDVADRYRVRSLIGLGSMGAVYEAERIADGVHVALKVLRPELNDNDDIVARFQREGKTLSLLRHRNIVELLDVGRLSEAAANGTFFLATELVRGVSLRSVMDECILEPKRALAIMRQVLDALGHAHAVGVVHRDVKPENIMLVDGGTPGEDTDLIKMLDFGVAKLLADTLAVLGDAKLTQTGITLLGTPMYMPPEMVIGTSIDARGDLYSVGVVVFELLTGKPPYDAANAAALMEMHASSPIPTLAKTSDRAFTPQLEHLVAEALAKKPDRRFASAAEMSAALDAAVHSLDVPAAPAGTGVPTTATMLGLTPAASVRAVPQGDARAPMMAGSAPSGPTPAAADFRAAYPPPRSRAPQNDRRRQYAIGGGIVAVAIVLLIALKGRGGGSTTSDLARRASDRLATSDPIGAIEMIERELAVPDARADADVYITLGHARIAANRRLEALAAYERAIALDSARAGDAQIRSNVTKILDGTDPSASIVALELLASRLEPPARDAIVAQAQAAKLADVRHRAFAIAERLGIAGSIDRVESWSLDLRQAATCDEKRTAVIKLGAVGDRRAVPALKKARSQYPCIDRDVADAIAALELTK
ncbi:MAG: Serine/threonine protein kinase PrkC, regulator of stationary phase [Myxococcales bacterium]|nr:Serine/threonine protein kinase PrkC, regulator of stationary phase [Myxococcales bacterium]